MPKRVHDRPEDKAGDPVPFDYESEEIKKYEAERHALFFTDKSCKKMFKKHIHTITNRRNRANGALYKNDPTILAWDLINEPRCETWAVPECGDHLQVRQSVGRNLIEMAFFGAELGCRDVCLSEIRGSKSFDHDRLRRLLCTQHKICVTQSTRLGRVHWTRLGSKPCTEGYRFCNYPRVAE